MNPLIQSQLQEIHRQVEALQGAIVATKERQALAVQERGKLQQEQWRHKKEIATLQRVSEDYDALQEENQRLVQTTADVRNHLRKVLACTKALVAEFKP